MPSKVVFESVRAEKPAGKRKGAASFQSEEGASSNKCSAEEAESNNVDSETERERVGERYMHPHIRHRILYGLSPQGALYSYFTPLLPRKTCEWAILPAGLNRPRSPREREREYACGGVSERYPSWPGRERERERKGRIFLLTLFTWCP